MKLHCDVCQMNMQYGCAHCVRGKDLKASQKHYYLQSIKCNCTEKIMHSHLPVGLQSTRTPLACKYAHSTPCYQSEICQWGRAASSSIAPLSLTDNAPISARGGRSDSSHLTEADVAPAAAEAFDAAWSDFENGGRTAELDGRRDAFGADGACGNRGDGDNGWRSNSRTTYGGACCAHREANRALSSESASGANAE